MTLWYQGAMAYLAKDNSSEEIHIVDIGDPTNPTLIGTIAVSIDEAAEKIAIEDRYLYVGLSNGTHELEVYDVSDPTSPILLGTSTVGNTMRDLYVRDQYAYIKDASADFRIFDVSDPSTITELSQTSINGNGQMEIVENYAYVSNGTATGLQIIDISSSTNPVFVASASTSDTALDIAVEGNYAYVITADIGAGEDDLEIFDLGGLQAPTAEIGSLLAGMVRIDEARINDLLSVDGGLNVGSDALISGTLSISGGASTTASGTVPALTTYGDIFPGVSLAYDLGSSSARWNNLWASTLNVGTSTWSIFNGDNGRLAFSNAAEQGGSEIFSMFSQGAGTLFNINEVSTTTVPNNSPYAWTIATSSTASPLLRVDTTTGAESLIFGAEGSDIYIGAVGNGSNLIFEEDSLIHGQGGNTLTFGQAGDIINFDVNVGIGTTSPGANLTINGTTGQNLFQIATSTNQNILSINENGQLLVGTSTAEGAAVLSVGGPLALGTNYINGFGETDRGIFFASNGSAEVRSVTGAQGGLTLSNTFSSDGTGNGIVFRSGTTIPMARIDSIVDGGTTDGYLSFQVRGSNTLTEQMRISPEGNVGIGTTSPTLGTTTEKLTVYGGGVVANNPTDPAILVGIDTDGNARSITIANRYAYVADDTNGLEIIDISDPTNPTIVGGVDTDGTAYSVTIADHYAYVADDSNGLEIIDISDPTAPSIMGGVSTDGSARGVTIAGRYAYVADLANGLEIIDVSDPTAPTIVGGVDTDGTAYSVTIAGRYAYVADSTNGLEIIDISDPATPSIVGGVDTDGFALDVTIAGRYAYVADSTNGLEIIDISDPATPSIVGGVDTDGFALDVTIAGRYAYVADDSNGLEIIDISSSTNPTIVGGVNTDGTARNVTIAGRYAYVADDSNGLEIIDIGGSEFSSLFAGAIGATQANIDQDLIVGQNFLVNSNANVGNDLRVGGTAFIGGTGSSTLHHVTPSLNVHGGGLAIQSQSTAPRWTQTGTDYSIPSGGRASMAQLSPNRIAFIDQDNDQLAVYEFNGTTWSEVGASTTISSAGLVDITALSPNQIVYFNNVDDDLEVHEWVDGTWTQVGSDFNISGGAGGAVMTALSPTRIAFIDTNIEELRVYEFDGSTWRQIGNGLSITGITGSMMTKLAANRVAFFDNALSQLRVYEFDGTDWTQVGTDFSPGGTIGSITTLSPNRIAYVDENNDDLRVYDFNGTTWSEIAELALGSGDTPEIVTLSANRIAYYDRTNEVLQTYQFSNPLFFAGDENDFPYFSVSDVGHTQTESMFVRTGLTIGTGATSTNGTSSGPVFEVWGESAFKSDAQFHGDVTIGDASTVALLNIHSNDSTQDLLSFSQGNSVQQWSIGNVGTNFNIYNFTGGDAGNTDLQFTITSASGSVGIGTSSPQAKLHVEGDVFVSVSDPVLLGGINIGSNAEDVEVVENLAFVVSDTTGDEFEIFDISDPTAPVKLGGAAAADTANAVVVSGEYAYVGTNNTGVDVQVYYIGDPTAPVEVGSVELNLNVRNMKMNGRHLYAVGNSSAEDLAVIDVGDQTNPVKVEGVDNTLGAIDGIDIAGNYMYLGWGVSAHQEFQVYDISDPTNLISVGGYDSSESVRRIDVVGTYAYVVTDFYNDLQVYDVSDPTTPTQIASVDLGADANTLQVRGDYAYVLTDDSGSGIELQVYDISSSTNPVSVAEADVAAGGNASGIDIIGDYAYVVSDSTDGNDAELEIFDLGGMEVPSASIGSLLATTFNVNTARVNKEFNVGGSFNVGSDALINGVLTITGAASSSLLSSNTNPALVVESGYVGIGTSSPDAILHIEEDLGGSNAAAFFFNTNAGDDDTYIAIGNTNATNEAGAIGFLEDANAIGLWVWGDAIGSGLNVVDGGSVGIGNESPDAELDVSGDIRVGTSGSNGCVENFAGTTIAGSACASDSVFKTAITPFLATTTSFADLMIEHATSSATSSILERLTAITPVTYEWNELAAEQLNNATGTLNFGLIAQDVERHLPELITYASTTGSSSIEYRQVNFSALPFYLMQAVKELYEEVRSLAARLAGVEEKAAEIDVLKTELEASNTRIDALEAAIGALESVTPAAVLESEPEEQADGPSDSGDSGSDDSTPPPSDPELPVTSTSTEATTTPDTSDTTSEDTASSTPDTTLEVVQEAEVQDETIEEIVPEAVAEETTTETTEETLVETEPASTPDVGEVVEEVSEPEPEPDVTEPESTE